MAVLFYLPNAAPVASGSSYPGAKLYFYLTGTSTSATVYTDDGLTTAHANPVVADSSGVFDPIYLDSSVSYRVVLKTSSGVTLRDVDPFPGALSTASSIGAILWERSAAEIAAGVTPTNYAYPEGNALRYGATGDGSTDDTSALLVWVSVLKQMTAPYGVLPPGRYKVSSTLALDVPDYTTLDLHGEIYTTALLAPAVRVGSPSAETFGVTVNGIKVTRSAVDTSGESVGVQLRNIVWSKIDVRWVTNFQDGLHVFADDADGGVSYCTITLGYLHDNKRNVYLSAEGAGYVNENTFIGGSLNHTTGYPAVVTVNLEIADHTNTLNNNRFIGLSLEDNSTDAVAAIINGSNNVLFWPRLERSDTPATYEVQFTADSLECAIVGNGFSYLNSNIDDAGANNCYETREGRRISHQVEDDAAKAVLTLHSSTTNDARLLLFEDVDNTVVGWVKGTGAASLKTLSLTNLGNYADDSAAAAGGVAVGGIYHNSGALRVRLT